MGFEQALRRPIETAILIGQAQDGRVDDARTARPQERSRRAGNRSGSSAINESDYIGLRESLGASLACVRGRLGAVS